MNRLRPPLSWALTALAAALAGATSAQDERPAALLQSGPTAATRLSPVTVYAPVGAQAGRTFDAVADFGRAPGAVLFVHELTRNTAPMIRALDQLGDELQVLGLFTSTVVLGADRNATEDLASRASLSLRLAQPLWVSTDGAEGPGAWALDRRATLTLVLCRDGVVVRSIAYTDTGRQDVPALRAALEELCGGPVPAEPAALREALQRNLPADPDTLRAFASRMAMRAWQRAQWPEPQQRPQREGAVAGERMQPGAPAAARPESPADPAARAHRGRAPDDEALRGLLRRIIRRDADAAALDAVFAELDRHVGDDADLLRQARDMLELVLGLDYGTEPARDRARRWLAAHPDGSAPPPEPAPERPGRGR
ncbi:MAG: hypothetical protein IPM29_00625 [Planctomycetes bacterium]|nr:hypothetical protein [Planctomycetota bacterium]